jgi:hypothetical protein
MRRLLQSPIAWAALLIAFWLTGLALTAWTASDPGSLRKLTLYIPAWWAVAFWTAGAAQWLWLPRGHWRTSDPWFRLARGTWVLGLLLLCLHILVTFELLLRWSHTDAVEHTRRTAGVGEGIYVNYLFLLTWTADATWLYLHPSSYVHRPRWLGCSIHGFLAFIVFNSTVVYGTGGLRWGAAVWFALLGLYLVRRVIFERPARTAVFLHEQQPPAT